MFIYSVFLKYTWSELGGPGTPTPPKSCLPPPTAPKHISRDFTELVQIRERKIIANVFEYKISTILFNIVLRKLVLWLQVAEMCGIRCNLLRSAPKFPTIFGRFETWRSNVSGSNEQQNSESSTVSQIFTQNVGTTRLPVISRRCISHVQHLCWPCLLEGHSSYLYI